MALGYEAIHSKNIAHLDNHAANYVVNELGYPILIDFGCA